MTTKQLRIAYVGAAVIIVISVAVWRFAPGISSWYDPRPVVKTRSECNLNTQSCTLRLGNTEAVISVAPPPEYFKPSVFTLQTAAQPNPAFQTISVRLVMPGMEMHLPPVALKALPPPLNTATRWQGIFMIPICSSGRHDWEVQLEVATATTRFLTLLPLRVGHS
ncbi:MAG: hypothetical protein HY080_13215 [Gammaproteobacteria bacterium]|nr:hypothetical protein [Gammaproteobacteria bacterium]